MRGRTSNIKISLTGEQRESLESLLRRQKTPVGLAKPARAMLLLAEGERFKQTADRVDLGERHLRKWARRFIEQGVEGLQDQLRPGRVLVFSLQSPCLWLKLPVNSPIRKASLCLHGIVPS